MKYTNDEWRKAKGIVKYVLDYSYNDSTDRLNTLQVVTDGIKTGMQWLDSNRASEIRNTCTLAVKLFARYERITNQES